MPKLPVRTPREVEARRTLLVQECEKLRRESAFARARPDFSADQIVAMESVADDLSAQARALSWVLAEGRKTAESPKNSQQ